MLRLTRKIHRITSYLLFIQVSLWILGGLTFALLPFDSVVKGGSVVTEPQVAPFPDNWPQVVSEVARYIDPVDGLTSSPSSQGPLIQLTTGKDKRWIRLSDGNQARRPAAGEIQQYAAGLYTGAAAAQTPVFMDEPVTRYLGLVDELYGRTGVWQVPFDDALGTRLYFEGDTGRYLTVRNDYWVFYDAMWRLHIMDYSSGSNFNNPLLIIFTLLATVFTISGVILTLMALNNDVRGGK
jgi:hypothetical protein